MTPPETASDIAKALEKRVADLEARVRRLESGGTGMKAVTDPCPICRAQMNLTDEHSHPTFGMLGVKERVFTCGSCGKQVKRNWDPAKP